MRFPSVLIQLFKMKLLVLFLIVIVLAEARWAPKGKNAEEVEPEAEALAKSYFRLPVRSTRFDAQDSLETELLKKILRAEMPSWEQVVYDPMYRG